MTNLQKQNLEKATFFLPNGQRCLKSRANLRSFKFFNKDFDISELDTKTWEFVKRHY